VWFPFPTTHWRCLFHHLVDLLQGQPLHLWDKEEDEGDTEDAKRAPKEEDFRPKVGVPWAGADEVRCNDSNDLDQK
jgi:hypothetical protein